MYTHTHIHTYIYIYIYIHTYIHLFIHIQLRTQEQLGYIVACRAKPLMATYPPTVNGLAVLIQSSFKDPAALDASAQRFLRAFLHNITAGGAGVAAEFQAHKAALRASILEKDTKVSQETQRLWKEITIRRYAWNRRQELAASLATLTLSEVGAFARELLRVKAHSIGVWIYGKGSEVPEDAALIPIEQRQDRTRIHSVGAFKNSDPAYWPLRMPALSAQQAAAVAPK